MSGENKVDKYTGKRLDARYEIQELIGVGGMAVVYRAYDIVEDKIVAIKILKDEFLGNQEFIRRFKNESKAIAVLAHPNIVKVYDVSFGTKIQYIVMEYIDGITLKEFISKQKNISFQDAVYFTHQILSALKHAHDKGVIHRDIKPQNIMLLSDGTIKVADFGIARFSRNETQTMTDRAIGSVHYISPEQAKGAVLDQKADIYSVGVMLYEMLTGKLPFEADNAVSVAIMQMQSKPKSLREINPDIPLALEQITLHAMQKLPINRYACAQDMIDDIEEFQNNPEISFDYKYFVDDEPTKHMESFGDKKKSKSDYDDDFNYEEEENKKSKAGIIAGGVMLGVGIFALIFILITMFTSCGRNSAKDVDVPNFIGMKLADIQNDPAYKFVWKVESVYDPNKAEGIIIDQEPLPNSKKVKEGATINLKVNSSGVLVTVPVVKGLTEEIAKSKLSNTGLKCEVLMVVDEETAEGIVCNVDPQEGTKVTADSTVRLYVSKGNTDEKVVVPDVLNKSLAVAKNELIAAGLKISDNITVEDSTKAKNTVISTNPLPGISVNKDSTVKITVSSGIRRERTLEVPVDLPYGVDHDVTMTFYVNGVLNSTQTIVPAYSSKYPFYIKGTSGKKTVNVNIDGAKYRIYEVDFDASSNCVKKLHAYEYVDKTTEEENYDEPADDDEEAEYET